MNGFICAAAKLNEHFVDKMCTDFIKNPFQMKNSSSPKPLMDCWGRAHPRGSKNSVHDGIKFFLRVDLVL
ncbi:hypothetical protein T02_13649 [Trichinella nativa]|uniref:Uncharacterized protein n=1 Tax=Trichinella nativa TaxID=6335 RepID=A0A0V1KSD5_9BILA|nr:hypothetical protein T02_13649 [Trichinella nativa]